MCIGMGVYRLRAHAFPGSIRLLPAVGCATSHTTRLLIWAIVIVEFIHPINAAIDYESAPPQPAGRLAGREQCGKRSQQKRLRARHVLVNGER